ncbi:flavodoxin [uncultured Microbacterium sp.]|uniref:flavodoxin n=1 Tax=uncultured Microbacterium sp. TaxID=191216 RepID=UPI0028D5F182|nr:flavodoxin [uncultured Microbacterium sp.]
MTAPATAAPRSPVATLLVYFSRPGENYWNGGRRTLDVGNTEVLANLIRDRLDCDVFRIEASDAYSDRYDPTVARNVDEQNTDARPAIADTLPDLSQYDRVLIGSPIWNVQPPMIMATFAEGADLAGTDLYPFVTYAVSGLGNTGSFYRDLNTGATLHDGLAVRGETVRDSGTIAAVEQWLRDGDLV